MWTFLRCSCWPLYGKCYAYSQKGAKEYMTLVMWLFKMHLLLLVYMFEWGNCIFKWNIVHVKLYWCVKLILLFFSQISCSQQRNNFLSCQKPIYWCRWCCVCAYVSAGMHASRDVFAVYVWACSRKSHSVWVCVLRQRTGRLVMKPL